MSDETEWVLINLDEDMARKQGLPPRLPIPKEEFEGLADSGLNIDKTRGWIKDFLNNSEPGKSGVWRKQNASLVTALEGFVDKAPMWARAQKAFAENDMEKAISTLKRITIMDSEDHAAKLNLASAYANMGEHEKALKAFKQIKKTFAGDPDFHVAIGQLHLAMQKADEAIDEFVNALEAQPDNQGALDALEKLGVLSKIYENPTDAASLMYIRADSVVDYLTGEWDKEERTADFFLELVNYHERENRHDVVIAAAERALKAGAEGSKKERAELAIVNAMRAKGDKAGAEARVREYLEKSPESAGAHVELARCHLAAGKKDEFLLMIDKALSIDPGDQLALKLRYWPDDSNDLHTVNATIPELQAFAEKNEKVAGVWRSLARALVVVGRDDEALAMLDKAVKLDEADDDLRAEWWNELAKHGESAKIIADAEALGDMKTRDWRLRWNEAEAYLSQGKKMEARALFSAINFDEKLHVDIRRRAKRAVNDLDGGQTPPAATTE